MTESVVTPPIVIHTLADVLGVVECSPAQGIGFLNTLANMISDRDSGSYQALQDAIVKLQTA